jgi:hypothetical protein
MKSACGLKMLLLLPLAGALVGCDPVETSLRSPRTSPTAATQTTPDGKPQARRVAVTRNGNVLLEIQGEQRRVVVLSVVCLTKGPLEQLLTRKDTKEHEAILAADVDARDIHKALLLARANPGSPVKFDPRFVPASGQTIKVYLEYESKGKMVRVPAQQWIRDIRTKKPMTHDWVFAGSREIKDPLNGKPIYLANDGDIICVSNFETALLDLPIKSSKDTESLGFEALTENIPPVGTKVAVILEPVPEKKQ